MNTNIPTNQNENRPAKTPIRIINEFHPTLEKSVVEVKRTIAKKEKRGYEPFLRRTRGLFSHPSF